LFFLFKFSFGKAPLPSPDFLKVFVMLLSYFIEAKGAR